MYSYTHTYKHVHILPCTLPQHADSHSHKRPTNTLTHTPPLAGQSDDEDDEGSPRSVQRMDSDDVLARLTGSGGETLVDAAARGHSLEQPGVEDEQVGGGEI